MDRAAANSNRTLRQQLEASLALTSPSVGFPTQPGRLAEPRPRVEPLACRDDALAEARDIAERSTFGTGFAFLTMGRWYAADQRPGIVDECVTIEIGAAERARLAAE